MAKIKTYADNNPARDQADKKQRKKQANQEEKLTLQLEQAKKDVRRAEQKLQKAQSRLEKNHSEVHALERRLSELRHEHSHPVATWQAQEQVAQVVGTQPP